MAKRRKSTRRNNDNTDIIEVSQGTYQGIEGAQVAIEEGDDLDDLEDIIQGYLDSCDVLDIKYCGHSTSVLIVFAQEGTATSRPAGSTMADIGNLANGVTQLLDALNNRRR